MERAVGLGIRPPLRPSGEHGLARRANEIQKAGVCVQAVRAVGLLDHHRHRTAVESYGESLFGTSQGVLGCDTLGHFIGETSVHRAQLGGALVYERVQFLHLPGAIWVSSHFFESACAIWSTSMLSNGFFRTST